MKKSTIVFVIGNVILLLLPIMLIIGLNYKIQNSNLTLQGDKNREEKYIYNDSQFTQELPVFHHIKLQFNEEHMLSYFKPSIQLDNNLNQILLQEKDTHLIKYFVQNDTLYIIPKNDSDIYNLSNFKIYAENNIQSVYVENVREITVFLQKGKDQKLSIEAINTHVNLKSFEEVVSINQVGEEYKYIVGYGMKYQNELQLKMKNNATIQFENISRFHLLDINLQNCPSDIFVGYKVLFDSLNLRTDSVSTLMINASDISKVNLLNQ